MDLASLSDTVLPTPLPVTTKRRQLSEWLSQLASGEIEQLRQLPDEFLFQWRSKTKNATAFHVAASTGEHPEVTVPFLIERGMDPNATNAEGKRVIEYTVSGKTQNSRAWVSQLIESGVTIDNMEGSLVGNSLASLFLERRCADMLSVIHEAGARRYHHPVDWSPIPIEGVIMHLNPAAPGQYVEAIRELDRLFPASQKDIDHLLYHSIQQQRWAWADHALSLGADIRVRQPTNGKNLLHALARQMIQPGRHNLEIRRWIGLSIELGCDMETLDAEKRTPVSIIEAAIKASRGSETVVENCRSALSLFEAETLRRATPPARSFRRSTRL